MKISPRLAVSSAFALNGAMMGTWASRIPAVMERHGMDKSQLGLMLLVMGMGAVLSFPIAGRKADRMGPAGLTRCLGIACPLALMLVGFAPSPAGLAVTLFLFGMCFGGMDVAMNAWGSAVEKQARHSLMASFHAKWSLGAGVAAAFGAGASALPLFAHFMLAAVLFGMAGLVMMIGQFDDLSPISASGGRRPKWDRTLLVIGLIALISGLGEGAVADWSAVYLLEVVGATEHHAALGFSAFSLSMVIMRMLADGAIGRWGPVLVARASGVLVLVGTVFIMTQKLVPSLIGFACLGLGYAALVPMSFSRAAADPHTSAGQAIASVAMFAYGAMLLGPPAVGLLSEWISLRMVFGLIGLLAIYVLLVARTLAYSRAS